MMETKYAMEITKENETMLRIESHDRDSLLQRARLYHKKHPDAIVMVYEVSCIFARETI